MTYGIHHAYWFALVLCVIAFVTSLFSKKKSVSDVTEAQ